MSYRVIFLFLILICLGGLTVYIQISKIATLDVNTILNNGPHAEKAAIHLKEAQEIYQYNLDVIEKKLATYKNKEQANAYLIEAARQLQAQLNASKTLVTQSLVDGLNLVLAEQKKEYDLIMKKDGIIYFNEDGNILNAIKAKPEDITSKVQALYANTIIHYPSLPMVIDNPDLPADSTKPIEKPKEEEKDKAESKKK